MTQTTLQPLEDNTKKMAKHLQTVTNIGILQSPGIF